MKTTNYQDLIQQLREVLDAGKSFGKYKLIDVQGLNLMAELAERSLSSCDDASREVKADPARLMATAFSAKLLHLYKSSTGEIKQAGPFKLKPESFSLEALFKANQKYCIYALIEQ